ncbi:MAG: 3',5'-cyclic-nucleotide phosphodiesterase [Nitrospirae bacterium]|nr:3',5'-cyclic-nucleotide phosphodiesterase [Nitrospirota bacterium]
MRIKVLGCSGAEFPGYSHPGFLLDEEILFDAGSLTNVLDEKSQLKIKNIFITHAHLDHIKGIPFFADNIIVKNKMHRVGIISIPPVLRTIKKNLFNSDIWPDFTIIPDPENSILNFLPVKHGKTLRLNSYSVTPIKVNHTVPAVGYLVEDKRERRFFYSGDTGPTDLTWKSIGDIQIHCLIIEVSFPNSMREIAINTGHLTAKLMKDELKKICKLPQKIYITHPKPQYSKLIKRELKLLKLRNLKMLKDREIITV